MLNLLDCALVSNHVYHTYYRKEHGVNISKMIEGKIQLPTYGRLNNTILAKVEDVTPAMKPSNLCYAQLYIKFRHGKATDAVVAIRGSQSWEDFLIDAITWGSDVLGDGDSTQLPWHYYPRALGFYWQARKYLRHYFPHLELLKLTGHSLGGGLAKLIVTDAGVGVPCCVFNAPGVADLPEVKKFHRGFIKNINARYGFINKVGVTMGTIDWVDVPNDGSQAKALFHDFDLKDFKLSIKRYQESDRLNRIAKNLGSPFADFHDVIEADAMADRLESFLDTLNQYKNSRFINSETQQCYQAKPLHYLLAALHLRTKIYCQEKKALASFTQVAREQHSMDNLINTLFQARYAILAAHVLTP